MSRHEISSALASSIPPPQLHEDHAIRDELDVEKLGTVLAGRDLDEIRDNRTDDDQPDLETDDSSAGEQLQQQQPRIPPDTSLEAITEGTDITTPVEMLIKDAGGMAEADHTSAQVSDFSEIAREEEGIMTAMLSSDGGHQRPISETLFDITDPEEDDEDLEDNIALVSRTGTEGDVIGGREQSEGTLLFEDSTMKENSSEGAVQLRIQKRQSQIDQKFQRLSQEMSFELARGSSIDKPEDEEDAFVRVVSQLSQREEDEAAVNFDQLVIDSFAEDKSEDWRLSSEVTPDMEAIPEAIFGAVERTAQGEIRIL